MGPRLDCYLARRAAHRGYSLEPLSPAGDAVLAVLRQAQGRLPHIAGHPRRRHVAGLPRRWFALYRHQRPDGFRHPRVFVLDELVVELVRVDTRAADHGVGGNFLEAAARVFCQMGPSVVWLDRAHGGDAFRHPRGQGVCPGGSGNNGLCQAQRSAARSRRKDCGKSRRVLRYHHVFDGFGGFGSMAARWAASPRRQDDLGHAVGLLLVYVVVLRPPGVVRPSQFLDVAGLCRSRAHLRGHRHSARGVRGSDRKAGAAHERGHSLRGRHLWLRQEQARAEGF